MSSKLYALAARFSTPEQILAVSQDLRDRGTKGWEVHTPYPMHALDDAMGRKPSRLPWVTFFTFMVMSILVFWFVYWTSVIDYPVNTGGKPYFAFLAWFPFIFEMMILTSVHATLFACILFFWKLRIFGHPLMDTEYTKATNSDQFGVTVEVDSEGFDRSALEAIFQKHNALVIEEIMVPEVDAKTLELPIIGKIRWNDGWMYPILAIKAVVVAFGTYATFNWVLYDNIPWIHKEVAGSSLHSVTGWDEVKDGPMNWMNVQNREETMAQSRFFADSASLREPVEGTVARGFLPYPYAKDQAALAEANLVNSLPLTKEALDRGQKAYMVQCAMCHGTFGDGDGVVVERGFPKPPSLHTGKLQSAKDGLFYHVISVGQGNMPGLDKQISREDRWAIVHYVRALQRAKNAKDTDLP
jgi:mono/diheme cytochrome c family protein